MTQTKSDKTKAKSNLFHNPKFLIGSIISAVAVIAIIAAIIIVALNSGFKEYSFSSPKDLKEYVELDKGIYKAEISFIDGLSDEKTEDLKPYSLAKLQSLTVVACKITVDDKNLFETVLVGSNSNIFYRYGDKNKPSETFEITEKKNYAIECMTDYDYNDAQREAAKNTTDLYTITITKQQK